MTATSVAIVPVWLVHCAGCRRTFKWKAGPDDVPPSHHSKQCARTHRQRLLEAMPVKCPRPDKRVWHSFEAAIDHANTFDNTHPLRPYRCVCGGIHLGRILARIIRYEIQEQAA